MFFTSLGWSELRKTVFYVSVLSDVLSVTLANGLGQYQRLQAQFFPIRTFPLVDW